MNLTSLIVFLLVGFATSGRLLEHSETKRRTLSESEQQAFLQYLAEQGKSYPNADDFTLREGLFSANQNWIVAQNEAALASETPNAALFGANQFSDMSMREKMQHLGLNSRILNWIKRRRERRNGGDEDESSESESLSDESEDESSRSDPASHVFDYDSETAQHDEASITSENGIDWRAKGMVNDVKDQGNCASAWAFAAVTQLESLYAIKNGGNLHSLSAQQLVDCATDGNNGCSGGFMSYVYDYYTANTALVSDSDYQYMAQQGVSCQAEQYESTGVMTSGRSTIHQDWDADDFKAALENGPISVGLSAGNNYLMNYQSGILDVTDCPTGVDMAAVIVGWGTDPESSQEYWIVRFSWGAAWGEGGYIRIAIKPSGDGVCGIQSLAVTVNVA